MKHKSSLILHYGVMAVLAGAVLLFPMLSSAAANRAFPYSDHLVLKKGNVQETPIIGRVLKGEVKNSGELCIKEITSNVMFFDTEGKPVFERQFLLINSLMDDLSGVEPLKPNYGRVFSLPIDDVSSDWAGDVEFIITGVSFCSPPTKTQPSDAIRQLQKELSDKGFKTGQIDGVWGPNTERAVRDYWKVHGGKKVSTNDFNELSKLFGSLLNEPPRTKPKPPPKKKNFDLDQIAVLLDKVPTEEEPVHETKSVPGAPEKVEKAPERGAGLQTGLTLIEEDALRVQVQRCWSVPAGAVNPEELVVTFRIFFNEDGTLARPPELLENGPYTLRANPFYRAAAESALRALQRCQPFRMPAGKYDVWKEFEMTFDPRLMVGR